MINNEEVLCYPAVPFVVCDNKEAHVFAHIKLNSTKRPCRFCKAEKYEIHRFFIEDCSTDPFVLRSFEELQENMNSNEWCDENSVHRDVSKVISVKNWRLNALIMYYEQSCILRNYSAFGNDIEHYFSVLPPDILHTVHAGVVRYSVCWALSILKASMAAY